MIANFTNAGINAQNDMRLAMMSWLTELELAYQRRVQRAREYFEGDQIVFLTDRLREFLALNDIDEADEEFNFNMNVIRVIVGAVTERMEIIGFESDEAIQRVSVANGDGTTRELEIKPFADWCYRAWQDYLLDALSSDVHDNGVNEGEHFVFVDIDAETKKLRFTPHPRYVDTNAGGDGFGCVAFYTVPNDPRTKLLYIEKRWIEYESGSATSVQYMNRYYPDRIEHFYNRGGGWEPYIPPAAEQNEEEEGVSAAVHVVIGNTTAWTAPNGEPLGIPIFHFYNRSMRPEAQDALPIQDAINKTMVDIMGAADSTGFQYHFLIGARLRDKDGNAIELTAGSVVTFPEKKPQDVAIHTVNAGDLSQLRQLKRDLVMDSAIVTDTPIARFQITGQVASGETQKEYEAPLVKKVKNRCSLFGAQWSALMQFAAKMMTLYGESDAPVPAVVTVRPKWQDPSPRNAVELATEVGIKREKCNISIQQGWRELGYSETQIQQMMLDKQAEMEMNTRALMTDTIVPGGQ